MRKLCFSLLLLFISFPLFAQTDEIAPQLTGSELIDYLQENYSVTNPRGYNGARDAMYGSIDNQNGNIVCVYTGFTIIANTRGEAFDKGVNTEHTWPQGLFDSDEPMRGDIHHLYPTRVEANSGRSNYPFDEIPDNQTNTWYFNDSQQSTIPASDIDLYSELLSGTSFEPREDHKGNVARSVFYFWSIYQDVANVADDASYFEGMKDILLTWHDADPVDQSEVNRSLGAEETQGNRNPFIHDTTLVRRAFFGGGPSEPDTLSNPVAGKMTDIGSSSFVLEHDNSKSTLFAYPDNLVTSDTDGNPFTLSDYDSIKIAEVQWEGTEQQPIAIMVTVQEFFESEPDTSNPGPKPSGTTLLITGVIDGPLSGGIPKAVELFAAKDISDLGMFGIGSANNGGGSDGTEFQLSGSAEEGNYIYVSTESSGFETWFGFQPDFTDEASVAINGDDAIELFYDSTKAFSGQEVVIDTFGEINIDGSGTSWEYADGWAYRKDLTGPDSTNFTIENWNFSGANALAGAGSNAESQTPFPAGTYVFKEETTSESAELIPESVLLNQNYPNPFNPVTTITYKLANSGFTTLKVYNITGREIETLVNGIQISGEYSIRFNASGLSSGVYFYQIKSGGFVLTKKMLLLK